MGLIKPKLLNILYVVSYTILMYSSCLTATQQMCLKDNKAAELGGPTPTQALKNLHSWMQ